MVDGHEMVTPARDEAIEVMDDFDSAWCRDGALYGKRYLGELLDAIPADVLARLAIERGAFVEVDIGSDEGGYLYDFNDRGRTLDMLKISLYRLADAEGRTAT